MITAWRLVHSRNVDEAFSGDGSRKHGGRWNSRGYRAVYMSQALSLATLEILVHGVPHETLKKFVCIPASIPEELIGSITTDKLPSNWRDDPPPLVLQCMGDRWIDSKEFAVLKVPSAIIPVEFNYIIDPEHPDFEKIDIGRAKRYTIDNRISKNG